MPPKRIRTEGVDATSTDERTNWARDMDEFLLDSHLNQTCLGNRPNGTFSAHAYNQILKELEEKFPNITWNKDKFKNGVKTLKKTWQKAYDLFKNASQSGWGYNENTHTWEVEPQVWNEFVQAHLEAHIWKDKPIPYYKKMEELYGKDRATREGADTASEIRARRVASTQQYSGSGSMINDIDDMTEQDEIQIEGFSSPGANETSPATVDVESGTTHANSSGAKRGKKGGKSKVDMELFFEKCEGMLSSGIEKLGRSINDIPLTPADEINRYGL